MPVRALLDTNILIHREAATVVKPEMGTLFKWLDQLGCQKCIHPASVAEIQKHHDPKVRAAFAAKLASYHQLQTLAPFHPDVTAVGAADVTENDKNDTRILNELPAGRVDLPSSEAQFIALCRKRSMFTDDQLREHWNWRKNDRPFIVGFLYAYSFPKRPNMKDLIDNGVIKDVHSAPRGFARVTSKQFKTVLSLAKVDPRSIVD
jgi:hypothetical protein